MDDLVTARIATSRSLQRTFLRLVLVASAYYFSGRLGFLWRPDEHYATFIWPPTGIAMAALLVWGNAMSLGIFCGALAANLRVHGVTELAFLITLFTTLGPWAGAQLLRRWMGFGTSFEGLRDVFAFVGLGAFGAMLITSIGGTASLLFTGAIGLPGVASTWMTWWLGDTLGVLLFTPPLLSLPQLSSELRLARQNRGEWFGLLLAIGFFFWAIRNPSFALAGSGTPLIFLAFPILIWSALRSGIGIASWVTAGLAVIVMVATTLEHDPIGVGNVYSRLIWLWCFLGVMALVGLFIVALQARTQRLHAALVESEARLRTAFDHLPFDFWICDQEGRYVALNASYVHHWGDHYGRRPEETDLPASVLRSCHANNALALKGQSVHTEVEYPVQGQRQYFYNVLAPIKVNDEVRGLLGVSIDISAHKHAENELTTLLNRLKSRHAAVVELSVNPAIRTGDLPSAARAMTESAARVIGAHRASLWLIHEDSNELACVDLFDAQLKRHIAGMRISLAQIPRYREALCSSRAIDASDAEFDPRTTELAATYLKPLGITSMLDAPVRIEGRPTGVLCLEHQGPLRAWTPDDVTVAGEIADLFAIALVNTELRKAETELARHRDHLEELVAARTAELEHANAELVREVTVRGQAEAALRVSEQRFRALVEMAPVVIVHLTPNGRILEFNPEAERVYGCKREDVIGKYYAELFMQAEWVPPVADAVRGVLAGIPMRAFECPILTVDKREREYTWHSDRVVDAGGAVSGIVHVGQDITEQKEVQRALTRAKESAESADRIKSVFLASMSHELRTPLNSIIGFTGILVQGLSGPLNERQLDQLRRVYGSAKHLLALISDVMDISRIEAGRFESIVEAVDLGQIMDQVLESLRPQAAEKNLELSAAVPAGISVTTDKRRLTQCLINLIGNALKYTEHGRVSIATLERGAFVDIAITDTGIGVDAAQQAKLFKPFERLNSELLAKVPGTGLGLYLTKKIATEILGGSVAVRSSPGKGSTFTLTIAHSVAPTAVA